MRLIVAAGAEIVGGPQSRVALPAWSMTIPHSLPGTSAPRRKGDTTPRLIAADAALSLVERWKTELNVLRRRSPTSDAVQTLADCVDELSAAITAGHDVTIQLTIAEANAVSRIPVSTLRWLCNQRPEVIGARKREGIWYIDRSLFESYMASPDGHAAVPSDGVITADTDNVIPLTRETRTDVRGEATR